MLFFLTPCLFNASCLRVWCRCRVVGQGYENMVKLNELNEPTILHNLRARYKRGDIYTYVRGTLLPFPTLPPAYPASHAAAMHHASPGRAARAC